MACRIASRIDPDTGKAAAGTIQVVKSHRVELMSSPPPIFAHSLVYSLIRFLALAGACFGHGEV